MFKEERVLDNGYVMGNIYLVNVVITYLLMSDGLWEVKKELDEIQYAPRTGDSLQKPRDWYWTRR
jgi:hypothetical protein